VLRQLFACDFYVQIMPDAFQLTLLEPPYPQLQVQANPGFTSSRLLVGQFSQASRCLREALGQLPGKGWIKRSPRLLLHPMALCEGGLSEVEERLLRELGLSAGAHQVRLHLGNPLSAEQAQALLRQAA
jgi:hypothetical protein